MRRPRVKEPGRACYHVMNRVIGKEFLFSEEAKEKFVEILRQVEAFSGVQVLTYCVMTNHFHLLLKVHDAEPIADGALLDRYRKVVAPITFTQFKGMWDRFAERKDEAGLHMLRNRLLARMNDLSAFMALLKQQFTRWYNETHGRAGGGSFWSDRFKSVLVEGSGNTLSTMAAYIDLNPVRAGMVSDPKDYRWCGYAAAVAGVKPAKAGLAAVLQSFLVNAKGVNVLAMYRLMLFGKLDRKLSGRVRLEDVERVFKAEGMLPPWVMGMQRVRWFSEGMIIGGKGFVHGFAEKWMGTLGLQRPPRPPPAPDQAGWCRMRGRESG